MDLLSTASLIFDIQWITDSLFGTGGAQSAQNATSLARASRASRIGTRAGRIVRIVRLIRLVKLYKHAQQVLLEKNMPLLDEEEKERAATTVVMNRRDSKLNTGSYEKKDTKKRYRIGSDQLDDDEGSKKQINIFILKTSLKVEKKIKKIKTLESSFGYYNPSL